MGSKGAKGIKECLPLSGEAVSDVTASFPAPDRYFHRYSVLPALSLDGIVALDIVQGSYNTKHFKRFIRGLLDEMNTFPGPRSVIVVDNCRIHKSKAITDMIYER